MPVKDKYTACLVFQDEDCEKNFRKVLDQKDQQGKNPIFLPKLSYNFFLYFTQKLIFFYCRTTYLCLS